MKCPNCGAEIASNAKACEYCRTAITSQMQKEQEQLNKAGCPRCGSTNISFSREKQGELRATNTTVIVRSTVGLCKDCGHTWSTSGEPEEEPPKRKTWLWVLGWIFIFPVPLTILLLRKNDMKPALKYGIIAAAWIVYLLIAFGGNSGKKADTAPDSTAQTVVAVEQSSSDTSALSPSDAENN